MRILPGYFWYILIALISIAAGVYAVCRNRGRYRVSSMLMLLLFMSGLTWICEFIVLGIFDAYAYKLDIYQNVWAENLLGHLILNSTLYPSAAIVVAVSKRRKLTYLLIVVTITLLDYLFVKSGIYAHHWWRTYMTTITASVLMLIAVKWFDRIKHGCKGYSRAVTFFFAALFIVHFPSPILLLSGKQYYHMTAVRTVFDDLYLTSIIIIFAYHLLESAELAILTCLLKNRYLKLVPFLVSIAAQCLFAYYRVLVIEDGWHLISTLSLYTAFIGIYMLLEKRTLQPYSSKPAAP